MLCARCLEAFGEERPRRRHIVAVDRLEEAHALDRGSAATPQFRSTAGLHHVRAARTVDDDDRVDGVLDERAEALLADPSLGELATRSGLEAALEPAKRDPEQQQEREPEQEDDRCHGEHEGVGLVRGCPAR